MWRYIFVHFKCCNILAFLQTHTYTHVLKHSRTRICMCQTYTLSEYVAAGLSKLLASPSSRYRYCHRHRHPHRTAVANFACDTQFKSNRIGRSAMRAERFSRLIVGLSVITCCQLDQPTHFRVIIYHSFLYDIYILFCMCMCVCIFNGA